MLKFSAGIRLHLLRPLDKRRNAMTSNRLGMWAIALATVGTLACGGDDGGPTPVEAEGSWQGSTTSQSGQQSTLSFTITETDGTVSGSGNLAAPSESVALSASGTYTEPSLSITFTAQVFNPLNLSATVGETNMTGTLNGSGFLNSAITLNRQ